jgi:hypothetical protein
MRDQTTLTSIFRLKLIIACAVVVAVSGTVKVTGQQLYSSPEEAVKALAQATKAKDQNGLTKIFGPGIRDFVSGDPVADAAQMEEFAAKISKATKLERATDDKMTLLIGDDDWPFAAPIVKFGDKWRFDTDAGVKEMLNRRIGMNEYYAVNLCQVYAVAQFEYFNGNDWDGDQVAEFAQKISSSEGKRDGLFWEMLSDNDVESPLGSLFAYAAAEGYRGKKGSVRSAAPFYGYIFKVLYRQGPSAPGGKYNYIINGNMIAGFALVAYPATWGNSGVMTFIVNQEGRVYQKNLGPQTKSIAEAMTDYDPDAGWSLAVLD